MPSKIIFYFKNIITWLFYPEEIIHQNTTLNIPGGEYCIPFALIIAKRK